MHAAAVFVACRAAVLSGQRAKPQRAAADRMACFHDALQYTVLVNNYLLDRLEQSLPAVKMVDAPL